MKIKIKIGKNKKHYFILILLFILNFLFFSANLSGSNSNSGNVDDAKGFDSGSKTFNYVLNRNYYPLLNISKPAKGQHYIDPNFHTTIIRVTDKKNDGLSLPRAILIPEYSRSSPENADGSRLLLTQGEYSLYLYDARTFKFLKGLSQYHGGTIPAHSDGSNEPRWDAKDPNIFYFVSRMKFYKYNIRTDTMTLIRNFQQDFPDGYLVGNDGEGEPSMDGRYWAFSVRGLPPKYPNYNKFVIFTYDLVENKIIKILNWADPNFPSCKPYGTHCGLNTITISPYGDRVIVEWTYPSPTISYALDFTDPVRLGNDGHSDIAIDAQGNQVHVIKDDSNDVIAMLDIKTGKRTNLVKLPLSGSWDGEGAYHISGNNYDTPGWAVISTYGGSSNNWFYYQVFMIELKDKPRIWRIAHTYGAYGSSDNDRYWSETKATINKKGTKIWWGSNWGDVGGDIDTYQVTLPVTWWRDLK